MSKILAIKGDEERGNEVIALLEMLGGDNKEHCQGIELGAYYYIDIRSCITYEDCFIEDELEIFTLDEFYKKYPFKVGDKVVYTKFGDNCDDYPVTIESMEWTGTTIEYTFNDYVTCLAKDLKMWEEEPKEVISGIYLNSCDYADEVELSLGDYEIEVRGNRTYAVKKKSKYPTTASECAYILPLRPYIGFCKQLPAKYAVQLKNLSQLFVYRDAYWKIAGDELGLDKPWEPNWTTFEGMPAIFRFRYNIVCDSVKNQHCLLVFPTEEMRDVFYENFKDLIESCKELL